MVLSKIFRYVCFRSLAADSPPKDLSARPSRLTQGAPTPEMRAAAMLEASKLSGAAKAKALADIKAADQSRPLAPLWQLMHRMAPSRGIMGFPELLD